MERREPTPSIAETVAETALAVPAAAAVGTASASTSISHLTSSSVVDEGRFLPGTLLGGRYRILGLLGRGGMGEVYRAMDLALGQAVALKFLPEEASQNPRLLERFHGEVRVARLVSHPNVCRVFDIGEIDGTPFISMEYVDGEDLASLLTRIGRLPSDKALQAARQLCAGLAAAHDRGVIHRDLKPQNIMMNKRGDVVIMDFGLAAIADQLSGAEVRNGTPAYMAPEQLRGSAVTGASDIYALGLVLYELFTGKRPFEAKNLQHLIDLQESVHLTSMTSIASDVDPGVERIVRRCLDPDPLKRPPGPLTVAAALPGGDPLAAALAAGETPSPELVANAGKAEGLALRYSIPCLAVIAASLIGCVIYQSTHVAQMMDPLSNPPDVLAHIGRDIATSFGYAERPGDTAVWMENRGDLVNYLRKLNVEKHWYEWFAAEAPMRAIYRESPHAMVAKPDGNMMDGLNPPLTEPGMVWMTVDAHGRLLAFQAAPRDAAGSATPADVFRAARLDSAQFHEIPPTLVPRHASDTVQAWEGPHPNIPNTTIKVQVAAWRGQITEVNVQYPWLASNAQTAPSAFLRFRDAMTLVLPVIGCFFALLVARRNWKQGRTDRQGALRAAIARFLFAMVAWIGYMHPIPSGGDMVTLFWNSAAESALFSGLLWIIYLAIEPAIRARYPHALITWNRLLAGRWSDPQVCSDILIGAAVGCALWVAATFLDPTYRGSVESSGNVFCILGVRQFIGRYSLNIATALTFGLLLFAVICFLRGLVRYNILAALVTAVIFSMQEGQMQSANWQVMAAIFISIYAALALVLIRFGLVASMATIFFVNGFSGIWLGSDWKAWFAPTGIATILLMLGIATIAFWKSLGSRDLLGGEPT